MGVLAIRSQGLTVRLGDRALLRSLDLSVDRGESVAIVGPSGSGKTTLLNCLAGLLDPSEGLVYVGDVAFTSLRPAARTQLRLTSIGMVYQFGELLPELSVMENVVLPAMLAGRPAAVYRERALQLLADLGIAKLAGRAGADLSGGERQRAGVARALMLMPSVVLADEPTGSLDRKAAARIADVLFGLPVQNACGLVIVTHNEAIAERSDRILRLDAGRLVDSA